MGISMTEFLAVTVLALLLLIWREVRSLRIAYDRQRGTQFLTASDDSITRAEQQVSAAWEAFIKATDGPAKEKAKNRHDFILARLEMARQSRLDVACGRKTLEQALREARPTLADFLRLNEIG